LISKAEYECVQLRRELEGLVVLPDSPAAPEVRVAPVQDEAAIVPLPVAPAKAA
jgi:hypothetical protein